MGGACSSKAAATGGHRRGPNIACEEDPKQPGPKHARAADQIRSHSQRRQRRARRARGLLPRPQRVARQHRDLVDLRRGSVQHVPAQHAWGQGGRGRGWRAAERAAAAVRSAARGGASVRGGGRPRGRADAAYGLPRSRCAGGGSHRDAGAAGFLWQEKRVPMTTRHAPLSSILSDSTLETTTRVVRPLRGALRGPRGAAPARAVDPGRRVRMIAGLCAA